MLSTEQKKMINDMYDLNSKFKDCYGYLDSKLYGVKLNGEIYIDDEPGIVLQYSKDSTVIDCEIRENNKISTSLRIERFWNASSYYKDSFLQIFSGANDIILSTGRYELLQNDHELFEDFYEEFESELFQLSLLLTQQEFMAYCCCSLIHVESSGYVTDTYIEMDNFDFNPAVISNSLKVMSNASAKLRESC